MTITDDLLINKILLDPKINIDNMNKSELYSLYNFLEKSPEDFDLFEKCLDKTKIYNNLNLSNIRNPYWFHQETTFSSNIWIIKINKKILSINFSEIKIDNNILLIDRPLILNTFKYWLCIQSHPIYNNSRLLKPETIFINISKIISFINSILINSDKLQLSKTNLDSIDENYIIDYLVTTATEGVLNASIKYNETISNYLRNQVKNIDISQIINFEKIYPFNYDDNNFKSLSREEIRKAKYWLFNNNAYSKYNPNKIKSKFFMHLYKNKIIIFNQHPPPLHYFNLLNEKTKTEYKQIPHTTNEDANFSYQDLQAHIKCLKKIAFIHSQTDCAQINVSNFSEINIKRINKLISLRPIGRYVTLPADIVFKSIRSSLEFINKYIDIILNTILEYSLYIKLTPDGSFYKFYNSEKFPIELKILGVKNLEISKDDNFYKNLRNNLGLYDLYNILLGSVLIVIGATTARRNSEIIELSPLTCLLPLNIDPSHCRDDFEIIFDNRKSGVGGINYHREKLARPIIRVIAEIIYKFQCFNKSIISNNLSNEKGIFLINTFSIRTNSWSKLNPKSYSDLLNIFCDYFELNIIEYNKNDYRRYYIRQHQLRRFFAMLFFWSNSFDGLDTLRYFLGHTDIEHLYHYITEPITGSVLNGIKSHTLTEAYLGNSAPVISNIEKLHDILIKHFNVKDLEICDSSLHHTLSSTSTLSRKINFLIDEHIIDLQPHFFTIENKEGKELQQFELILILEDDL